MLKFSFTALLLLFAICKLDAQQVLIRGKITDTSGVAIPFSGIQNLRDHSGTTADSNGVYAFRTTLPAKIRVSSIGYHVAQREIPIGNFSDSVVVLDFKLVAAANVLQSVNITAKHLPIPLAESNTLLDFEMKSGQLYLLYQNRRGEKIELADTNGTARAHYYIRNRAEDLHKTAHGFLYSLTGDSAYVYQYDTATGFTQFSVPLDTFKKVALAIAEYRYPCYYYMVDTAMRTRIIYYYDNKLTGEKAPLFVYMNEQMFASNMEINANVLMLAGVGGGPPGMAGENAALNQRTLARAHISNQTAMLESSHCELHIVRDSIYLFNFDLDSIYVFNANNRLVRSMPLQCDLYGAQYLNKMVVVDEEKRECYFRYEVRGITHLDQIDLNNGERKSAAALERFPFLEKVRISNGFAYFCYFTPSDTGKRTVMRQQID